LKPASVWHFCASPVDPEAETGGVSNVVRALALESSRQGVKTTVVCGSHELGQFKWAPGLRRHGAHLTTVTLPTDDVLGSFRQLRRIVAGMSSADAAHVHAGFSPFADGAMWLLRRRRLPYIYSPHGKLSEGMLRNRGRIKALWWSAIGRANGNGAALIGVAADGERDQFARLGLTAPTMTIPNGFTMTSAAGLDAAPLIAPPYLLFLGYLDPRKQPALLVKAFAASRARDTVRLALVGPDSYGHRTELEALSQSLGLGDRVLFHGPAYGEDKWNILGHALALALPSLAEGMPLVLVEAAGAGIPSIFSTGSNGQILSQAGAGLEIQGDDPSAWAAALDLIVDDVARRTRMSLAAKDISASLTWSEIGKRWMSVYSTLAGC
jgi:glycosyltransferase involved in cell wall biosynthesis